MWESAAGVLTQTEFCRTLEVSRTSLWRYCKQGGSARNQGPAAVLSAPRDESWQDRVRELCERFVTYGYRRIAVLLRREGHQVGLHKVRLWMRESGLAQSGPVKDEGRTPGERPPEPEAPNKSWQIDATKIYTSLDGWVWQTSILDLFDRRIVGHVVRKTCKAEDAMDTLARALDAEFGELKPEGLSLIHDRGSQFTAWKFKQMVEKAKINDVVTAVRHPQSCGRLERFHRTQKEECVWLQEWEGLADLEGAVAQYVHHYNHERIHSALAYLTPMEAHRLAIAEQSSLSKAA